MKKTLMVAVVSLLFGHVGMAAEPVNLISYNIRYAASGDLGTKSWTARKATAVAYLLQSKAGMIGLQEALHAQLEDVKKGLPGFVSLGVGRDDGKTKGEYSPILYDPQQWTPDPKEQGTFWLSETPSVIGSKTWGNEIPRICSWARFTDKAGKSLYVYNVHWDHQSQASREKAAGLILKVIAKRVHQDEPVVLMGDFNATTDNPAIQTLLKSGELVDHGGDPQSASFNGWSPGLVSGLRIDHIFTSKTVKVAEFKVESNGDPVGSDHHPVILRGVEY